MPKELLLTVNKEGYSDHYRGYHKPFGQVIVDIAAIGYNDIKSIIEQCPYNNKPCDAEYLNHSLAWFFAELSRKFDFITSHFLICDFDTIYSDYLADKLNFIERTNEVVEYNEKQGIKKSLFFISDKYKAFGDTTIEQFFSLFLVYYHELHLFVFGVLDDLIDDNDTDFKDLLFDRYSEAQHIESYIKTDNSGKLVHLFCFKGVYSLLAFEIYNIIDSGICLKKCNNCNKFFIARNRSDTIYCDRESPQDNRKTCKEYGAMKAYQDNLKTNEAMGLYRNIYMQKQMLMKRNPDIKKYADDFQNYKISTKQWKADVKSGAKTESEYIEWLKSVKEKKV